MYFPMTSDHVNGFEHRDSKLCCRFVSRFYGVDVSFVYLNLCGLVDLVVGVRTCDEESAHV